MCSSTTESILTRQFHRDCYKAWITQDFQSRRNPTPDISFSSECEPNVVVLRIKLRSLISRKYFYVYVGLMKEDQFFFEGRTTFLHQVIRERFAQFHDKCGHQISILKENYNKLMIDMIGLDIETLIFQSCVRQSIHLVSNSMPVDEERADCLKTLLSHSRPSSTGSFFTARF